VIVELVSKSFLAALVVLLMCLGCSNPSSNAPQLDGYEVGNGGVVYVCQSAGNAPTIELLDFYRAKVKLNQSYVFDFGTNSKTIAEKVSFALTRLRRLDETRVDFYQREASRFFDRAKFVDEASLPDTRDYGDLPVRAGCSVQQLVIQNQPVVNGEVQFLINNGLWAKLDTDRQAATILHEIIYEDAIFRGQKNSLNVQLLVALICSPILDTYSQLEYNQMMIRAGMATVHEQSPVWERNPFQVDGIYCDGMPFSLDLSLYASHPAKDLLSFLPVSLPAWLSVDSGGLLQGVPEGTRATSSAFIRATNGVAYSDVEVRLETMDCAKEPLIIEWRAGILQHGALPMAMPRRYAKLDGPDWLFYNARSGDLSGTPPLTAVGDNTFSFQATAETYSNLDIKLIIHVVSSATQISLQIEKEQSASRGNRP